jgi:hypothetical protein
VRNAVAAKAIKHDDAAVSSKTMLQVANGFSGGLPGRALAAYAVGCPFRQHQLHDRFSPAGC